MNPDRYAQVKDLVLRVADMSPEERQAVLDDACKDDPELRGEIDSILVHDQGTHQILKFDALLHRVLDDSPATEPAHGSSPRITSPRLTGQTISHYRILDLIGEGGMGQVYRARDARLGREVAFKVISPTLSADAERIRRFEQEARAAGSLNHPNIVAIYDIGVHENAPFVVMELLDGESLRQRLKQGPIPVRKAIDYAAQCARGLAAAHAKGIVHRDIKPENLIVAKDGRVKILDFGVAKLMRTDIFITPEETSADSLTGTGAIIGTSGYMSPEQARGRSADPRSDIFALGATLYEMLTGHRTFQKNSFIETLHAIMNEDPPPMSASGREIPATIEAIVRHCLEKNPEERFQSGWDLAFALETFRRPAVSSEGTSAPTRSRFARFTKYAVGALALALVVLIARRLATDQAKVDLGRYLQRPLASSLARQTMASWSPDGKSLAFLGRKDDSILSRNQIWIQRDGAVTAVPVAMPLSGFDRVGGPLLWSPDGRMLYFPGSIGDRGGVYRIPSGGGDPVLVQPGDQRAVALSPDGQTLAWIAQDSSDVCRLWYASPPDAPRSLYGLTPSVTGSLDQSWVGFAPDGSKLLLSLRTPTVGQKCWILGWPPAKIRPIFPALSGITPLFSWMPDSRHVVFSMQHDPAQPSRIYLGDTRSGRFWPVLLGQGEGVVAPCVAPDGRRFAFTSLSVTYVVIEVSIESGTSRTILEGLRVYDQPALSADGEEIVYTSTVRGPQEVWLRDLTSGLDRLLATPGDFPGAEGFGTPALSPDGRRFAVPVHRWTSSLGTVSQLYVGLVGGGAPIRATTEEGATERGATWSPDGTALAYLRWTLPLYPPCVAVVHPGELEPPMRLLERCLSWVNPEWSPTGEWIAVVGEDGSSIVLVSPDAQLRKDLPVKSGWRPGVLGWSPDGRLLYMVRYPANSEIPRGELASLDVKTGRERVIRDLGPLVPENYMGLGTRISVTPDGRCLVYSVGRKRLEIWSLEGVQVPRPWHAGLLHRS